MTQSPRRAVQAHNLDQLAQPAKRPVQSAKQRAVGKHPRRAAELVGQAEGDGTGPPDDPAQRHDLVAVGIFHCLEPALCNAICDGQGRPAEAPGGSQPVQHRIHQMPCALDMGRRIGQQPSLAKVAHGDRRQAHRALIRKAVAAAKGASAAANSVTAPVKASAGVGFSTSSAFSTARAPKISVGI